MKAVLLGITEFIFKVYRKGTFVTKKPLMLMVFSQLISATDFSTQNQGLNPAAALCNFFDDTFNLIKLSFI